MKTLEQVRQESQEARKVIEASRADRARGALRLAEIRSSVVAEAPRPPRSHGEWKARKAGANLTTQGETTSIQTFVKGLGDWGATIMRYRRRVSSGLVPASEIGDPNDLVAWRKAVAKWGAVDAPISDSQFGGGSAA